MPSKLFWFFVIFAGFIGLWFTAPAWVEWLIVFMLGALKILEINLKD